MPTYIPKLLVAVVLLAIAACADQPRTQDNDKGPPNTVQIEVTFDSDGCVVVTQTASQSCNFYGDKDPKDVACQKKSDNNGSRWIAWSTGDGIEFELEFENDEHPFKNISRNPCELDDRSETFTCKVRKKNEDDELKWDYKYSVIVGSDDDCNLDPKIYLMN
jgi:hypothetical protein